MKPTTKMDERQERELKEVGSKGFWLLFWYLFICIVVQTIWWKPNLQIIGGEMIGLFLCSIVILAGCVKRGLWDCYTEPNPKTYCIASLIITAISIVILALTWPLPNKTFLFYMLSALIVFAASFGLLWFFGSLVKRRRKHLEAQYDDRGDR